MYKKALVCLFSLMAFISTIDAQEYYLKSFAPYLKNLQQEVLLNDDVIICGNIDSNSLNQIVVYRLNPCGNILWAKKFSDSLYSLDIIDMKTDNNQNIIIGGNYNLNSKRNPFILSIDDQANTNFFYHLDTGTEDIAYTMDVNEQDQIYLYYKEDVGTVGPFSRNKVVKFDGLGKFLWGKDYGFTAFWGQMYANTEGGFIITNSREVCKFDTNGDLVWNKYFDNPHNSQKHFSTPSGYVIFHNAQPNFPIMLNKDGSVKWNGPIVNTFRYVRGILRKNGNLLFLGYFGSKTALMELDSSNGSLLHIKLMQFENSVPYAAFDLSELTDSTIVYSGIEGLSTVGSSFISRKHDTLSNPNCTDTFVIPNYTLDSSKTFNGQGWNPIISNVDIKEPTLEVINFPIAKSISICFFSDAPLLNLGKDTILCPNVAFSLGTDIPQYDSYLWSTGQTSKNILVKKSDLYWLKAIHGCDTLIDSIQIDYHPIVKLDLGMDTSICNGDSITLSTGGVMAQWSTGEIASSIQVGKAGIYWARINTLCGDIIDSVVVDYVILLKPPLLGADSILCFSDSLILEVDSNASFIQWSNSSNQASIKVKTAGTYSVIIANACDTLKDTIEIGYYPEIILKASVSPVVANVGDSIYFNLDSPSSGSKILWTLGDASTSIKPKFIHTYKSAGNYEIELIFEDSLSCEASINFNVTINELPVYIPNVFSPNSDGIYDKFGIFGKHLSHIEMKIFNRWGNLVYQSNDYHWDGRDLSGKPLTNGIYYYLISFEQLGKPKQKVQGSVTLLKNQ